MALGTLEKQFQTSLHTSTGKLRLLFYLFFPVYSSTFVRALSFQKNEIRSLGPFITCEPANVPRVVERGKMIHAPGN